MSSSEFEFNVFKLGLEGARKQEEIDRKKLRFYAAKMERERIIKLIENNMMGRDSWLDVIELIKGEQK